jgi:hypothetical protein
MGNNAISKLNSWFNTRSNSAQGVIILLFISSCVFAFFTLSNYLVQSRANHLLEPYVAADTILVKALKKTQAHTLFPADKFDILNYEYYFLQERKRHHLISALYFLRNDYSVTITLMLLSVAGALVLFTLINRGWSDAGVKLKALFLSIVAASLFYGLFPTVFKPEENYTRNLNRYIDYSKLQIYLLQQYSYLAAPSDHYYFFDTVFTKNKKIKSVSRSFLDTASYLNDIDYTIDSTYKAINYYSDLILSMDEKKVKGISEIYQSLNSLINGSRAPTDSLIHK